jgi:hypothetical protein
LELRKPCQNKVLAEVRPKGYGQVGGFVVKSAVLQEQRLAEFARARQRGIDIEIIELIYRLSANVSHRHEEIGRKLALHHEIPRLDVTSL